MSLRKIPIVVLASGRGSNFSAIQDAIRRGELNADIRAVISDKKDAPVLEKAKAGGIESFAVPWSLGSSEGARTLEEKRRFHEGLLLEAIGRLHPSPLFVVLAGYMRILTPRLIDSFQCDRGYSRIVNIHPSILPAFPGLNAYSQAFHFGAKVAGVTVHLVENAVDGGPICAQEVFSISDCQSAEEVERRGLTVEHRIYPKTLEWVLQEDFHLEKRPEGRFCVRPN